MVLWEGTIKTTAPEAVFGHLRKSGPSHLCPSSTHSLPQSNLAVMCCLTSLMRSWVRWPTSTCLLRSRISFITCQSRWNKSPSFFCGGRKWWGKMEEEEISRGSDTVSESKGRNESEIDKKEKTEWGWQTEGKTQIRRWKKYSCTETPKKRKRSLRTNIREPNRHWEEEGDP